MLAEFGYVVMQAGRNNCEKSIELMDDFGQNPEIFKQFLCHRNQRKILVMIWPFLLHKSLLF